MSSNSQSNSVAPMANDNTDTLEIQETEVVPVETVSSITSGWTSLLPMILIFAVFYFLLLRPQEKRRREKEKLVSDVKKGEEVLMNSGIYGVVTKVDEKNINIEVEIAQNVYVKVLKTAILDITSRSKTDPKAISKDKNNKNDKKVISAKSS